MTGTGVRKCLSIAFIVIFMTGCKTIRLQESHFILPQSAETMPAFSQAGYKYSEHRVIRSDGSMAHGISMTKSGNQLSILFFGGNKFLLAESGENVFSQLVQFNANIYMFDHRGYGSSIDEPSLKLLMGDAIENFDYVKSKVGGKLIIHGHSLGSFEAAWVAKNREVDALILESSVTHIDDWVKDYTPWYVKPFVKFEIADQLRIINNLEVVRQLKSPLLLMVGSRDKLTSKKLSQRLFQAASSEIKALHVFKKANHTDVRSHHLFNAVYQSFIDTVFKG